jgi:murein DD-endopeptidase MepM/ murein hydrolase activator NlpD
MNTNHQSPQDQHLLNQIEQAVQHQQQTGHPLVDELAHLRPIPPRQLQERLAAELFDPAEAHTLQRHAPTTRSNSRRIGGPGYWVLAAAVFAAIFISLSWFYRPGTIPAAQNVTEATMTLPPTVTPPGQLAVPTVGSDTLIPPDQMIVVTAAPGETLPQQDVLIPTLLPPTAIISSGRIGVSIPITNSTFNLLEPGDALQIGDTVDVYQTSQIGNELTIRRVAHGASVVYMGVMPEGGPNPILTVAVTMEEANAFAAGGMMQSWAIQRAAPLPDEARVPVFITTRPIWWGTQFTDQSEALPFQMVYVEDDQVPPYAIYANPQTLAGMTVRWNLPLGQILREMDLTDATYNADSLPDGAGVIEIPRSQVMNDLSGVQRWDPVHIMVTVAEWDGADFVAQAMLIPLLEGARLISEPDADTLQLVVPDAGQVLLAETFLDALGSQQLALTVTLAQSVSARQQYENLPIYNCQTLADSDFNRVWGYPVSNWSDGGSFSATHSGLDFVAPEGELVRASNRGRVAFAGTDPTGNGFGNLVVIQHGPFRTYYAHLQEVRVQCDQALQAGDIIGTVGSTGTIVEPHLHFEIHLGGLPLNPAHFFTDESPR